MTQRGGSSSITASGYKVGSPDVCCEALYDYGLLNCSLQVTYICITIYLNVAIRYIVQLQLRCGRDSVYGIAKINVGSKLRQVLAVPFRDIRL